MKGEDIFSPLLDAVFTCDEKSVKMWKKLRLVDEIKLVQLLLELCRACLQTFSGKIFFYVSQIRFAGVYEADPKANTSFW